MSLIKKFLTWALLRLVEKPEQSVVYHSAPTATQDPVPPAPEPEPEQDEEEEYNLYKPKERLIYTYWDGFKDVACDPYVLYKKLMAKGTDLSIDIKVANSQSKDAAAAHNSMIAKLRIIFDLKSYEEGGLTELETIGLMDHFLLFARRVKKNTSHFPTSQTATSDSSPSSTEGNRPTTNGSDSGSTANEPSTAEPPPSPGVSA